MTKSNKKSIGDLEEMSVEDPPLDESLYCKTDAKRTFVRDFPEEMSPTNALGVEAERIEGLNRSKDSSPAAYFSHEQSIVGNATKKECGGTETILQEKQRIAGRMKKKASVPNDTSKSNYGGETILQEKERIAGRRSKVALAPPADANKSNSEEETILQEKERIAGRRTKKATVPTDASKPNYGEETILQEKQRIAVRGKHDTFNKADLGVAPGEKPPDRVANPDEEPSEVDPDAYPGAYRVNGPEHSSSAVSVDSYGGFTTMTEDAMPNQPPDAQGSRPSSNNYPSMDTNAKCIVMPNQPHDNQCSLPSNNDPSMNTNAKCVNRRVMYWVAGVALLLAIIATVVGIVVSVGDPKGTPSPVNAATTNGVCSMQEIVLECQDGESVFASDIPDCASEQYNSLLGLLKEVDPTLVDMEETSCAPENLALLTLALTATEANSTDKYILNVFYFSTSGHEWFDSSGWLSIEHQCTWRGIFCNDEGVIESLEMESNNLSGSIPTELGLLTELSKLDLKHNTLTGSIPTELGLLTELSVMYLYKNNLNGTIPTELGL